MTMHRFDSFEESPPPPPHPHSHLNLESSLDFSNPPNSREPSGDYCPSTLPLTINGGPKSNYGSENINMIPYGGGVMTPDFVGYGGSGGVIIGSGGVITSGSGLSGLGSQAGTLSRNGNSSATATIKRTSMLDLTSTHTLNNDLDSAGPTDTMLSQSANSKHPLPDDDTDDPSNQLDPHINQPSHYHHPQQHHSSSLIASSQQHHPLHHSSSSPHQHFQSNTRLHRLAQKHGLNKKGLVLLILSCAMCVLLLVALLTMVALWPRATEGDHTEVCLTPDCLRASAQVSNYLFYNHVRPYHGCGNAINNFWGPRPEVQSRRLECARLHIYNVSIVRIVHWIGSYNTYL